MRRESLFENIISCERPCYWFLPQSEPELYSKIKAIEPSISIIEQLSLIPAQKKVKITLKEESSMIIRPHRHWRAVYIRLRDYSKSYNGYLAYKGTEAFAENIIELLMNMQATHSIFSWSIRKSGFNLPKNNHCLLSLDERFLKIENKLPALYQLSEAIEATKTAIYLHKAYLNAYETLPKIPIPLAIYNLNEEDIQRLFTCYQAVYKNKNLAMIKNLLLDGVAIQCYWYPALPERVAHINFPTAYSSQSFQERIDYISKFTDIDKCINDWILLFTRFLNLGVLLFDPSTAHSGFCLDPGNLVLDGGIVDINNFSLLDNFQDRSKLQFIFESAIELIHDAILILLVGTDSSSVFPDLKKNIYSAIEKTIQSDKMAQRDIHPLVENYIFSNKDSSYTEIIGSFFEL